VVDVEQEDDHARQHEDERHGHRDLRDERVCLGGAGDRPKHDQRVHERRDEDAQSDLVDPVTQEGAHDAGRELAAGQLQDHDGDGEHEPGERDHRGDDRGEHGACALRSSCEEERQPEGGLEPVVQRGQT
jgi:hypothetical protein